MKIKNEDIFIHFGKSHYLDNSKEIPEITELGREQFFNHQSSGIVPNNPDEYYNFLIIGKWGFDFICSELYKSYFNGEWFGWLQLWFDWEGNRKFLKKLCSWHKSIPEWVTMELTRKELEVKYGI